MQFGLVTAELTELICERQVRHGHKMGVFSRISLGYSLQDRFSPPFHYSYMKALSVQMMDLYLIFQFVKEHCHGNQMMLKEMHANTDFFYKIKNTEFLTDYL